MSANHSLPSGLVPVWASVKVDQKARGAPEVGKYTQPGDWQALWSLISRKESWTVQSIACAPSDLPFLAPSFLSHPTPLFSWVPCSVFQHRAAGQRCDVLPHRCHECGLLSGPFPPFWEQPLPAVTVSGTITARSNFWFSLPAPIVGLNWLWWLKISVLELFPCKWWWCGAKCWARFSPVSFFKSSRYPSQSELHQIGYSKLRSEP